jgi:hypothetical protein
MFRETLMCYVLPVKYSSRMTGNTKANKHIINITPLGPKTLNSNSRAMAVMHTFIKIIP